MNRKNNNSRHIKSTDSHLKSIKQHNKSNNTLKGDRITEEKALQVLVQTLQSLRAITEKEIN